MNLQITGQLVGMEARNGGWMAVGIQEPNSQYPKKLSTKKPELIQQAQSLMGQIVTAAYNESEGNQINPHTGTPYINRYLEALALGQVQLAQPQMQPQGGMQAPQQQYQQPVQQAPIQQPMQPMVQQQPMVTQPMVQGAPMTDAREMKIMRQSAAKVSVELLQHLSEGERTLSSLVAISEQLVKYFNEGVVWNVAPVQPQQPAPVQQQQYAGDPGPMNQGAPAPGDDDIPF